MRSRLRRRVSSGTPSGWGPLIAIRSISSHVPPRKVSPSTNPKCHLRHPNVAAFVSAWLAIPSSICFLGVADACPSLQFRAGGVAVGRSSERRPFAYLRGIFAELVGGDAMDAIAAARTSCALSLSASTPWRHGSPTSHLLCGLSISMKGMHQVVTVEMLSKTFTHLSWGFCIFNAKSRVTREMIQRSLRRLWMTLAMLNASNASLEINPCAPVIVHHLEADSSLRQLVSPLLNYKILRNSASISSSPPTNVETAIWVDRQDHQYREFYFILILKVTWFAEVTLLVLILRWVAHYA